MGRFPETYDDLEHSSLFFNCFSSWVTFQKTKCRALIRYNKDSDFANVQCTDIAFNSLIYCNIWHDIYSKYQYSHHGKKYCSSLIMCWCIIAALITAKQLT